MSRRRYTTQFSTIHAQTVAALKSEPWAEVGPHEFDQLGRLRHRSKCRACYLPRSAHPTSWTVARPVGDTSDSDPANDPFSGEPGTPTSAGSWGNSNQDSDPAKRPA